MLPKHLAGWFISYMFAMFRHWFLSTAHVTNPPGYESRAMAAMAALPLRDGQRHESTRGFPLYLGFGWTWHFSNWIWQPTSAFDCSSVNFSLRSKQQQEWQEWQEHTNSCNENSNSKTMTRLVSGDKVWYGLHNLLRFCCMYSPTDR